MSGSEGRPSAGSRWRLLVHTPDAKRGYPHTAVAHTIVPESTGRPPGQHATELVLPGALFDELVVGSWLHVEEMGMGEGGNAEDGRRRRLDHQLQTVRRS